ncbi:MAG: hypothetical protein LBJ14_03765 [Desulfarculales bacterium]|jgi:hypothetical protein|nr:hypothetical protein [Desulfarculales bacterium]
MAGRLFFAFIMLSLALPCQAAQSVFITVLDSRQKPVPDVTLQIRPLAGALQTISGPSDPQGGIFISWEPESRETAGVGEDQLADYVTSFQWRAEAPGFISDSGQVESAQPSRRMHSPQLTSLDVRPASVPLHQKIILHRPAELWEDGLASTQPELLDWGRGFYERNFLLLRALGTELLWPAFAFKDNALTVYAQYKDYGWAGAAESSLPARAALNAYLPWCILLAGELEGLPSISVINLIFMTNISSSPSDAHSLAPPFRLQTSLPLDALSQAAARADNFDDVACSYPLLQTY